MFHCARSKHKWSRLHHGWPPRSINAESERIMHEIIFSKKREALLAGDWERAAKLHELDVAWRSVLNPAPPHREILSLA